MLVTTSQQQKCVKVEQTLTRLESTFSFFSFNFLFSLNSKSIRVLYRIYINWLTSDNNLAELSCLHAQTHGVDKDDPGNIDIGETLCGRGPGALGINNNAGLLSLRQTGLQSQLTEYKYF